MTPEKIRKKRGRPVANKQLDKSKVLEKAVKEFAQKGFDGAQLKIIAKEANMAPSLINYHFEGKEDLWKQAVQQLGQKLAERFQEVRRYFKDLEGIPWIKAYTRQFVYFSAEHPEFYKIVFHEMCDPSERTKWLIDTILKPLHDELGVKLSPETVANHKIFSATSLAHFSSLLIGAANIFFVHAFEMQYRFGVDSLSQEEIEKYADFVNETLFARFE